MAEVEGTTRGGGGRWRRRSGGGPRVAVRPAYASTARRRAASGPGAWSIDGGHSARRPGRVAECGGAVDGVEGRGGGRLRRPAGATRLEGSVGAGSAVEIDFR